MMVFSHGKLYESANQSGGIAKPNPLKGNFKPLLSNKPVYTMESQVDSQKGEGEQKFNTCLYE